MLRDSMSPLTVMASVQFPAAQLPKVIASSRQVVWNFIDTASPTVFTHDVAKTGVGRLLTPNDLRDAFQDESVTVSVSQGRAFRYEGGSEISGRRMPFADYATYVENSDRQSSERLYLSQFPVDTIPAILGPDVATPSYIPDDSSPVTKNLWFGPEGTISPLHFDRSHNLLHQHWGRKHVVMVDPSHFHQLKPGSKNSGSPHVSSLDLVTSGFNVDLSRLDAPCLEAILEPGDVLFLPAFWWHNVISIDVAISINYWWRPPISACLYPSFFRMLSSRTVYHDPSVVTQWVDVAPHRLDTALCVFLADEGHTFGAAALAGAIVAAFCDKVLRMLGIPDSRRPMPEVGTGTLPNFAQAATVIPALTAQGLINGSQSTLLLKWLELAEETAAEPEPRVYTAERSTAVRDMIWRLHVELGKWLSM
jgi:lysine-specific demethylase 8